jgi:hypothetical protein
LGIEQEGVALRLLAPVIASGIGAVLDVRGRGGALREMLVHLGAGELGAPASDAGHGWAWPDGRSSPI